MRGDRVGSSGEVIDRGDAGHIVPYQSDLLASGAVEIYLEDGVRIIIISRACALRHVAIDTIGIVVCSVCFFASAEQQDKGDDYEGYVAHRGYLMYGKSIALSGISKWESRVGVNDRSTPDFMEGHCRSSGRCGDIAFQL